MRVLPSLPSAVLTCRVLRRVPAVPTAARVMAGHDLNGVSAFLDARVPKLHTLAHCVIDYRGHRVVAQSVIPGIFHDRSSEHVYGTMDNGKTYKRDPEFHQIMQQAARTLHIKEHKVRRCGLYLMINLMMNLMVKSDHSDARETEEECSGGEDHCIVTTTERPYGGGGR